MKIKLFTPRELFDKYGPEIHKDNNILIARIGPNGFYCGIDPALYKRMCKGWLRMIAENSANKIFEVEFEDHFWWIPEEFIKEKMENK